MENAKKDDKNKTQNLENDDNSKKHYIGKIIDKYENRYEGSILNEMADGFGVKYYKDGRKYEGEFKNNKRNGYGTLYRPDGTIFKGYYKDDYQHGLGTNYTKEGQILQGYLEDGVVINGSSIMYYGNGTNDYLNFEEECRYEGQYRNGKREGFGKFFMTNGDRYEGEFQNNHYNGRGIYYWQNGLYYIGKFKDDKKEGFGILCSPQFGKIIGLWKNEQQFQVRFEPPQ